MLPLIFNKRGRLNIATDDLLRKIKEVLIEIRLLGAVVLRKIVIFIGNGVSKANDLNNFYESGGHITLTDDWARGILQSVDCVKGKRTTGKIEPSPSTSS